MRSLLPQNYRGEKYVIWYWGTFREIGYFWKRKKNLVKEVREEFPQDDMLFELHLFRAINYLKKLKAEKWEIIEQLDVSNNLKIRFESLINWFLIHYNQDLILIWWVHIKKS